MARAHFTFGILLFACSSGDSTLEGPQSPAPATTQPSDAGSNTPSGTETLASAAGKPEPAPANPEPAPANPELAPATPKPVQPPFKACTLSIRPGQEALMGESRWSGTVTKIESPKPGSYGRAAMTRIVAGKNEFLLGGLPQPEILPIAVGNTIDVILRCDAHGPHLLCDGRIDREGQMVVGVSGSGSVGLFAGWKVQRGKIVEQSQVRNQKRRSIRRRHELEIQSKGIKGSVLGCKALGEDSKRWLVGGHGNSWDGVRPPEGVDYQMFSMIRL